MFDVVVFEVYMSLEDNLTAPQSLTSLKTYFFKRKSHWLLTMEEDKQPHLILSSMSIVDTYKDYIVSHSILLKWQPSL